ncbi:MAG TPA: hypothetical protein VG722_01850, partial [Tepidisphaeraceae bacterium]|nr:hypothetical protein [Tepidisphaeraceae bacterium]
MFEQFEVSNSRKTGVGQGRGSRKARARVRSLLNGVGGAVRSRFSSAIREATMPERMPVFEMVENRVLLSATITANQFTLLDDGAGNAAGVIALDSTTTAGVQAEITTTNGSPDQATTINLNLDPTDANAAGTTYNVLLFMDGTNASSTPNITFSHVNAGDIVNLHIINEQINDNSGSGSFTPSGNTSAYTAATYVADSNYTGPNPTTNDVTPGGDGGDFAAVGNIGTTTFVTSIGGGAMTIDNLAAAGNVGLTTLPALDLSTATATSLSITSEATGAATTNGGVTIGNLTLGGANNTGATITTEASTGANAAQVTVGNVTTGSGNGSGDLTINTPSGINLGSVTIGTITMGGTSSTAVRIQPGGTSTIGTVSTGAIGISGSGNDVVIIGQGGDTTTFGGGINLGVVTDSSTNVGGGNVDIEAASITGATTLGGFTLTDTTAGTPEHNYGSFTLNDAGAAGGISLGTISMGDTDSSTADTGTYSVSV